MSEASTPPAPAAPEPQRHYLPPGHILTVIASEEGPCTVQRLAPKRHGQAAGSEVVYDIEGAVGPVLTIGPFEQDRQYAISGAKSHSVKLAPPPK